eukprot:gene5303-18548_t
MCRGGGDETPSEPKPVPKTNPAKSITPSGANAGVTAAHKTAPAVPLEAISPEKAFNLRDGGLLIAGRCVYLQAGDPGDFDGYLIAAAALVLQNNTKELQSVIVVPERRACSDRNEPDANCHEQEFSEQVLSTASRVLTSVCPDVYAVRGPLNARNIIPLKFIFSEPDKYGPLTEGKQAATLHTMQELADLVNDTHVSSVLLDMNGSLGFLPALINLAPNLGAKLKASGMPITIMAGVQAEAKTATLPVIGRDPRSTMNAIYNQGAVKTMLDLAKKEDIPLLFVTNNVCNRELKFENCEELSEAFKLQGFLKDIATAWYGPHLKGKCVPFDWVSFVAMLCVNRFPSLLSIEKTDLYVGNDDASVLVLRDRKITEMDEIIKNNLTETYLWGTVDAVVSVNRHVMLQLGQIVSEMCSKGSST